MFLLPGALIGSVPQISVLRAKFCWLGDVEEITRSWKRMSCANEYAVTARKLFSFSYTPSNNFWCAVWYKHAACFCFMYQIMGGSMQRKNRLEILEIPRVPWNVQSS